MAKKLLLLISLAIAPSFITAETPEEPVKVTEESTYTNEDIAKAKKAAIIRIIGGTSFVVGAGIIYKISEYITKNDSKYKFVKYVTTGKIN
jgi:hypothetical protein